MNTATSIWAIWRLALNESRPLNLVVGLNAWLLMIFVVAYFLADVEEVRYVLFATTTLFAFHIVLYVPYFFYARRLLIDKREEEDTGL
ncbi:MAG: hypothetical protein GKR90_25685 [Pseudomonadales bacterium]|nr:hypothetical protein [Pseudomonadales bacterium]